MVAFSKEWGLLDAPRVMDLEIIPEGVVDALRRHLRAMADI